MNGAAALSAERAIKQSESEQHHDEREKPELLPVPEEVPELSCLVPNGPSRSALHSKFGGPGIIRPGTGAGYRSELLAIALDCVFGCLARQPVAVDLPSFHLVSRKDLPNSRRTTTKGVMIDEEEQREDEPRHDPGQRPRDPVHPEAEEQQPQLGQDQRDREQPEADPRAAGPSSWVWAPTTGSRSIAGLSGSGRSGPGRSAT